MGLTRSQMWSRIRSSKLSNNGTCNIKREPFYWYRTLHKSISELCKVTVYKYIGWNKDWTNSSYKGQRDWKAQRYVLQVWLSRKRLQLQEATLKLICIYFHFNVIVMKMAKETEKERVQLDNAQDTLNHFNSQNLRIAQLQSCKGKKCSSSLIN